MGVPMNTKQKPDSILTREDSEYLCRTSEARFEEFISRISKDEKVLGIFSRPHPALNRGEDQ